MKPKIILLVEDNSDDVALTLDAFQHCNIANRVVVARDGPAALDYVFCTGEHRLRERHLDPAVVLLDLNLPKINGLEVLRLIRAEPRTKRLPIVVLTSSKEEQDIVASYDLGANSYIRKPVDFDRFLTAVQQLGLYWLLLNEAPPQEVGAP
jgi:two-component system, response regulator